MATGGFQRFSTSHKDLILAVGYNIYATRAVTASADHRVRIWDRDEKTGEYAVSDSWFAHDATVTEAKWNGPFTGQHIGTIGEDGMFRLWQEDVNEKLNSGRRWKKVFELATATGVPYISMGFKNIGAESYLALTTRDGYITICEPVDHEDMTVWRTMWSDYLCRTPPRTEETSFQLSWHQEKLPAWPAVLAGLDRKSLSLAVAVGNVVKVFRTDKDRKFYTAAVLEGAKDLVRSVAWANGSMRGFDTIAAASKDDFIRVYELHTPGASSFSTLSSASADDEPSQLRFPAPRPARSGIGAGLAGGTKGKRDDHANVPGAVKQEAKLTAELQLDRGMPWRVLWSPTADLLISNADDRSVKIWTKSAEGKWIETAEVDAGR